MIFLLMYFTIIHKYLTSFKSFLPSVNVVEGQRMQAVCSSLNIFAAFRCIRSVSFSGCLYTHDIQPLQVCLDDLLFLWSVASAECLMPCWKTNLCSSLKVPLNDSPSSFPSTLTSFSCLFSTAPTQTQLGSARHSLSAFPLVLFS